MTRAPPLYMRRGATAVALALLLRGSAAQQGRNCTDYDKKIGAMFGPSWTCKALSAHKFCDVKIAKLYEEDAYLQPVTIREMTACPDDKECGSSRADERVAICGCSCPVTKPRPHQCRNGKRPSGTLDPADRRCCNVPGWMDESGFGCAKYVKSKWCCSKRAGNFGCNARHYMPALGPPSNRVSLAKGLHSDFGCCDACARQCFDDDAHVQASMLAAGQTIVRGWPVAGLCRKVVALASANNLSKPCARDQDSVIASASGGLLSTCDAMASLLPKTIYGKCGRAVDQRTGAPVTLQQLLDDLLATFGQCENRTAVKHIHGMHGSETFADVCCKTCASGQQLKLRGLSPSEVCAKLDDALGIDQLAE
eukprot:COSAG05_NODE_4835_length_1355_cov_1.724522_1_plen_365_part_10